MIIVLSILLAIVTIYAAYVTWILIQKHNSIANLRDWIYYYSEKTSLIKSMMHEIDTNGSFAADDEVGYVFDTLKALMDKLGIEEDDVKYTDNPEDQEETEQ